MIEKRTANQIGQGQEGGASDVLQGGDEVKKIGESKNERV
jgi:hypothetical protein